MATLLLKQLPIGHVDGVLFDKDGTLSFSEPSLLSLAERRIKHVCELWARTRDRSRLTQLEATLKEAYGLTGSGSLRPDGTLAVAARQDNLTTTATVLCLYGCSWPEASGLALACFDAVDQAAGESSPCVALLPGARALLHALKEQHVCCAVISNDTKAGIQQFLNEHRLNECISRNWSAEDRPRKPDPNAVKRLCEQMQVSPKRCALIGDAETDLQMAQMAGVEHVIGYRGGWSIKPELPSAQHTIDHWHDLCVASGQ